MVKQSSSKYSMRKYTIAGAMVFVVLIFIARLFFIQVLTDEYRTAGENLAFLKKTLYPSRGLIYDCKGKLVVYNKATANIQVITREIQPFDSLELCKILDISIEQLRTRFAEIRDKKKNRGYSSYTPQLLFSQISTEEASLLEEKLYKFPGFYVEHRTTRDYNYSSAALLLGTVGEVSQKDIDRDPYYVPSDYAGTTGIERYYEKYLRGIKGTTVLLRDAHGRVQGQYEDGKYDEQLTSGHNLRLSIDMALQEYGEMLMQNKRGAIVMLNPKTGEIKALISAPTYDPSMLIGKERGNNFKMLQEDRAKPLFNRATLGAYPPGSTFKPIQAATFLQEGAIVPSTMYSCHRGYPMGYRNKPACHGHASPLDLTHALATSCNAYFCWGLREYLDNRNRYPSIQEAFESWKSHIVSMGFGYKLGIDLPSESRGYIPNSGVYDKLFNKKWTSGSVISISIGQGEILATPLQIANAGAVIANRGYFMTPHIVSEIEGVPSDSLHIERHQTTIEAKHFDAIIQGMRMAVTGGTCRKANIPDIAVCGKTGTSENPHGKDHSLFMGFAPMEDPEIVIAVIVENGGFGATFGVPIGRLMLEYYFHDGEVSPGLKGTEQSIMNTRVEYPLW